MANSYPAIIAREVAACLARKWAQLCIWSTQSINRCLSATTLTLTTVFNCISIGFQRGTHANWQLLTNDATGVPTPTDMGTSFVIAAGRVLTHYIAAAPNGASACVSLVYEVTGAVFGQEITVDLPATSQFLSPRLYMNNGVTAAAVAYDCSGI